MNQIYIAVLLFFHFLLYKFQRIKLRKWRVYAEFEQPISYYLCRVLVRIRFDDALSEWSACTVNIGAVCIPLGLVWDGTTTIRGYPSFSTDENKAG